MSEARIAARTLLRKASEDLYAAACLGDNPLVSPWTVGFHAQQAVEKSLKAAFAHRAIRYPFIHDIEALVVIVKNESLPLPRDSEELSCLTPFAALFRYEDEDWGAPVSISVERMLGLAETTVAWARAMLDEGSASSGV